MKHLFRLWRGRPCGASLTGVVLCMVILSSEAALAVRLPLPTVATTVAYVVNNALDNVAVIDTSTNTVVATISVGDGPRRVVFSPDSQRAYVTNNLENTVSVIDTAISAEIDVDGNPTNGLTRIPLSPEAGPYGIDITPDGSRVYVGNERSGSVSVIDTTTHSVIAILPLGTANFAPRSPAITPDGRQVWVGVGAGANTIQVFDIPSHTLLVTIPNIIGNAERLEFLPDGSFAFAHNACGQCGNLQKISTATNAVVATLFYGSNGNEAMAVAADGSVLYTGIGGGGGQGVEIDPVSLSIMRSFPTPSSATGMALAPAGQHLYVATAAGVVLVVARATLTEVATITVGGFPTDVVITTVTLAPRAVTIDIRPGSAANNIVPNSLGRIPVAILTTATFDASTVNSSTVRFGATGTEAAPVRATLEDVDGDMDIDLKLLFSIQQTGIQCGATSAALTGETLTGQAIAGADMIHPVGCK